MMKRTLVIITVLALVALAMPAAHAAAGAFGRQGQDGAREVCSYPDLGLTAEQLARMQQLREEFRPTMEEARQRHAEIRNIIREARRDPGADPAQLEAGLQEMAGLRAAMLNKAREHRDALESILTEEQSAQLAERLACGPLGEGPFGRPDGADGQGFRGKGMGGRGGRGPGPGGGGQGASGGN